MDDEQPLWRRIGTKSLGIAAAIGAFALFKLAPLLFGYAAGHGAVSLLREHARSVETDKTLDSLTGDPRFNGAYSTMEREFPNDYAAFKSKLKAATLNSASSEEAYNSGKTLMQQWIAARRPYVLKADDAHVIRLLVDQEQILDYLKDKDFSACASFGMNGQMPAFARNDTELLRLASSSLTDTLTAIKAGMDHPVTSSANLSAKAQADYGKEIRRLPDSRGVIKLIAADKVASGSTQEQCDAAIILVRAANNLEDSERGQVARSMFASP